MEQVIVVESKEDHRGYEKRGEPGEGGSEGQKGRGKGRGTRQTSEQRRGEKERGAKEHALNTEYRVGADEYT
eukprot:scaffold33064_cov13-Prasinocladus_malaysianus.AAC.1